MRGSHSKLYRAIILADVHLSNRLPFSSGEILPDGRTSRFLDQLVGLRYVAKYANANEVDEVFVLGDLFDKSSIDGFALFDVLEVLRLFKAPVTIIPGNHDAETVSGSRFGTRFLAAKEFKEAGIEYIEEPTVHRYFDWLSFYLAPYRSLEQNGADIEGLRESLRPAAKDLAILFMHNSILGADHYGWKCDRGLDPEFVCDRFDAVFSGHFHQPQKFGARGGVYVGRYAGGLIPLDFRDAIEVTEGEPAPGKGRRGFFVVDFEPRKFRTTFKPVPAPRFYLARSVDDLGGFKPASEDFLKIQIEATSSAWIGLRPEAEGRADQLRSETGATVIVEHTLAPEGDVRLESATPGSVESWEALIAEYVDMEATDELDPELLKEIGIDTIADLVEW